MNKFLDKAASAYYEGRPIISDDEWDYLAELYKYDKVGAKPTTGRRIRHFYRLYSLQKFYENDTLPFNNSEDIVITPKLDGSTLCLTYVNGSLIAGATRGDGIEGENITHLCECWEAIPKSITTPYPFLQITGEVVSPKSIVNARNYAAGALRLKDEKEFLSRDVHFYAHGIHPSVYTYYIEDMEYLEDVGFKTVYTEKDLDNFPQDGLVYRINLNDKFYNYGFTDKHPRGAFALKHTSDVEKVETELLDVVWQVGKSGKVTPVAIFEEIDIDGAKINRATLHNAGFIEDLDLHLGDTIIVTRAGGIIPKVLGVL